MTMPPDAVDRVSGMISAGHSQQEIADYFGIHVKSLYRWRRKMKMPLLRPDPMSVHIGALYRRWLYVHDIRAIGVRAVRETA